MFDYTKNIDKIPELNEEEKAFLSQYLSVAREDLKRCYKAGSREYKYWWRWLKNHQHVIYKIKHYNQLQLISNSKQAFDFVLSQCVDLFYSSKNKNDTKNAIKSLDLINKICGLESYAQQTIANLNQANKQSDLAKLTTEQLQQLVSNVQANIRLLSDTKTNHAEREQSDKSEDCVSDTHQAIVIDELNKD